MLIISVSPSSHLPDRVECTHFAGQVLCTAAGNDHRLAAHEIAGFRNVLIGMHDEYFVFVQDVVAVGSDLWLHRSERHAVTARAHVWRPRILSVAGVV